MYQGLCFAALAPLISSAVVIHSRNGVRVLSPFHHLLAFRWRRTDMCCPTSRLRTDTGNCQRVQRLESCFATRASGLSLSVSNATDPFAGVTLP